MNSIYDKTSNQAIIERINKLTPDSEALWGKMTVDQMLSHCIAPIDLALGNSKLKVNFIMQLLGKILKKKILNSNEFKKNSPTAPSFIRNNKYNFEDVKSELIQKFSTFSELKHQAIKRKEHPFFGKMSYEDWDKLHWMHIDHHLRQFGV